MRDDFGDYMQLPPSEKCVSTHIEAFIDMDTPYTEYQKRFRKGERFF